MGNPIFESRLEGRIPLRRSAKKEESSRVTTMVTSSQPEARRRRDSDGECSALPARTATLAWAALAIWMTGCRGPMLTQQQSEGQHLYAVRCAHCHEENDLALKPPPPDIHGAMRKGKLPSGAAATDAGVRTLVLNGKGKMPSFSGRFTEQQMAALLAYLHTSMPQPER